MATRKRVFFWLLSIFSIIGNKVNAEEIEVFSTSGLLRDGSSLVYGCKAGNETGPCVASQDLCISQGGQFVGYCFYDNNYQGVCCLGLDPANAQLTTTNAPPSVNDDPEVPTTPTVPSVTTPTTPTVPAVPTTPEIPAVPTTPTVPAVPTTPEIPAVPTTPTTPTVPTTPEIPAVPTTPTVPAVPTTPEIPAVPTTPTVPTTPEIPAVPTTPTVPAVPTTPEIPAVPTTPTTPTVPTTPEIPSIPALPSVPTTPSVPSLPTNPPSLQDSPVDPSCSIVSYESHSTFNNPAYPSLDTKPSVYQYTVVPQPGVCAVRVEFTDSVLAGRSADGCSVDSVVILGSGDLKTAPQCGLLQGYRYTVRTTPEQTVRVVVTTQSSAYLWSTNVTQINCDSVKPYQDFESPECGEKNEKTSSTRMKKKSKKPWIRTIPSTRLLQSKRKSFRKVVAPDPPAITRLLQSAIVSTPQVKIVKGNETGINEWPWQVLLMLNGKPMCGGSLLNEEWVVTAAHCVQFSLPYPLASLLTVDLGDHDLKTVRETKNVVARVSQIVPNIYYSDVHNDIALIRLAGKIPFSKTIKPICFPPPAKPVDTYEGKVGKTTGWGRTENYVISSVLREANMEIISTKQCKSEWAAIGEGGGDLIDDNKICAGGDDVGPCNGDSGGPLVVKEQDKWRLVGLTSFGSVRGCALSGIPTVFTRITSYLDWIALNLAV